MRPEGQDSEEAGSRCDRRTGFMHMRPGHLLGKLEVGGPHPGFDALLSPS